MTDIVWVTPEFAIGAQIELADIARLREAGFAAVINARPDDEDGTYITADEAGAVAADHALAYVHCPTENHAIFEADIIDRFELALTDLPKPIFAHCKSGTRAAILWGLVAARHRPVEEVIATLQAAGQDLDFLADELRAAAEAPRGSLLQLKADALLNLGRSTLFRRGQTSSDPQ